MNTKLAALTTTMLLTFVAPVAFGQVVLNGPTVKTLLADKGSVCDGDRDPNYRNVWDVDVTPGADLVVDILFDEGDDIAHIQTWIEVDGVQVDIPHDADGDASRRLKVLTAEGDSIRVVVMSTANNKEWSPCYGYAIEVLETVVVGDGGIGVCRSDANEGLEGNDDIESATMTELYQTEVGTICGGDADVFTLEVPPAETWDLEATLTHTWQQQTLGDRGHLVLRLLDAEGKVLDEVDSAKGQASVRVPMGKGGIFHVEVVGLDEEQTSTFTLELGASPQEPKPLPLPKPLPEEDKPEEDQKPTPKIEG